MQDRRLRSLKGRSDRSDHGIALSRVADHYLATRRAGFLKLHDLQPGNDFKQTRKDDPARTRMFRRTTWPCGSISRVEEASLRAPA